jgi:hypothetical protein
VPTQPDAPPTGIKHRFLRLSSGFFRSPRIGLALDPARRRGAA